MHTVSLSEAKDRLSEIVSIAERGEDVVITRHGKPRAKLVAIDDDEARLKQQREALAALKTYRAARAPVGITLDEIVGWVHGDGDG